MGTGSKRGTISRRSKRDRGTVAVAMSGGVDSSLTALLLAEQGYEVIGFTLHLHDEGERGSSEAASSNRCCGSADMVARARQAALKAGGRHHVLDGRREFEAMVIRDFEQEYAAGRTPNPCVRCNTWLKWGFLREKSREFGADRFATGHYARVIRIGEESWGLASGVDPLKDQSYALWGVPRSLLSTTLLPIGEMSKPEVRALATRHGLKAADVPDSQDICFIIGDDYREFLQQRLDGDYREDLARALEPGDIIDGEGNVLGRHGGVARYTIGQRHGLGIAAGQPLYVERLDPGTRTVILGDGSGLLSNELQATDVHWVSIDTPQEPFRAGVKIRYGSDSTPALVTPEGEGSFRVNFDVPQRAVTPGQSAVVYDGEIVLGGGVIAGYFRTDA